MDLKNLSSREILNYLDDLADHIPEGIASILKKASAAILFVMLVSAAWYGWGMGAGKAVQEGQQLAPDTRSLFQEEIERAYNRDRKEIVVHPEDFSAESVSQDSGYEFYSKKENMEKMEIIPETKGLIKPEYDNSPEIMETPVIPGKSENERVPELDLPTGNKELLKPESKKPGLLMP